MQYRTQEGDMLDAICKQVYGSEAGYVERVLDDNLGLVEYGPVLPANLIIHLPKPLQAEPVKTTVRLWD